MLSAVRLRVKSTKNMTSFLISNFRRVLNVLCFLLDNSPASEFYMPMFWNRQCSETSEYKFRRQGITQKKAYYITSDGVYTVKYKKSNILKLE